MNRNEPELITGVAYADDYMSTPKGMTLEEELKMLRSGDTVEMHEAAPKTAEKLLKKNKGRKPQSVELRRFRSSNSRLRIQMETTKPRLSPEGYWVDGESRFIQFKPYAAGGGYYETDDFDEQLVIERSTGYGSSVYDVDAMAERAQVSKADFVEKLLENDTELAKRLRAKLGAKDFVEEDKENSAKKEKTSKSQSKDFGG